MKTSAALADKSRASREPFQQARLVVVGGALGEPHWVLNAHGSTVVRIGGGVDCTWRMRACGNSSVELMFSGGTLLVRSVQQEGPVTLNAGILWDSWVPAEPEDLLRIGDVVLRVHLEGAPEFDDSPGSLLSESGVLDTRWTAHSLRQRRKRRVGLLLAVAAVAAWLWLVFHLD